LKKLDEPQRMNVWDERFSSLNITGSEHAEEQFAGPNRASRDTGVLENSTFLNKTAVMIQMVLIGQSYCLEGEESETGLLVQ
jgi:hypothetical protein